MPRKMGAKKTQLVVLIHARLVFKAVGVANCMVMGVAGGHSVKLQLNFTERKKKVFIG